jgi:hypothetical protein
LAERIDPQKKTKLTYKTKAGEELDIKIFNRNTQDKTPKPELLPVVDKNLNTGEKKVNSELNINNHGEVEIEEKSNAEKESSNITLNVVRNEANIVINVDSSVTSEVPHAEKNETTLNAEKIEITQVLNVEKNDDKKVGVDDSTSETKSSITKNASSTVPVSNFDSNVAGSIPHKNYQSTKHNSSSRFQVEAKQTIENNISSTITKNSSRKHLRDKLTAADSASSGAASSTGDDVLSAFKPTITAAEEIETKKVSVETKIEEKVEATASKVADNSSLPDSWDDENAYVDLDIAKMVEVKPVETISSTSTTRSLRPTQYLLGTSVINQNMALIKKYTKEQLLSFKPTTPPAYGSLSHYTNIITVNIDGQPSVRGKSGNFNANQNNAASSWPKNSLRADNYDQNQPADWKRENPQNVPKNAPRSKQPPPPVPVMPRKVFTDAIEKLSSDIVAILNKITPQTFDKLCLKFVELEVSNTDMLDKVIQLIFEKAVQEQGFTSLYAEFCNYLNSNTSKWVFYSIVHDIDSNHFFWIKNSTFDESYSGPLKSLQECIDAASDVSSQSSVEKSNVDVQSLETVEICFKNSFLIKVRNINGLYIVVLTIYILIF